MCVFKCSVTYLISSCLWATWKASGNSLNVWAHNLSLIYQLLVLTLGGLRRHRVQPRRSRRQSVHHEGDHQWCQRLLQLHRKHNLPQSRFRRWYWSRYVGLSGWVYYTSHSLLNTLVYHSFEMKTTMKRAKKAPCTKIWYLNNYLRPYYTFRPLSELILLIISIISWAFIALFILTPPRPLDPIFYWNNWWDRNFEKSMLIWENKVLSSAVKSHFRSACFNRSVRFPRLDKI